MTDDTPPMKPLAPEGLSELTKRVLSGAVMASVAIATAIWGGWPFVLIWTLAAVAVAYEWQRLVHGEESRLPFGVAAFGVLLAVGAVALSQPMVFYGIVVIILLGFGVSPAGKRSETATGIVYASAFCAAVLLCRGQGSTGLIVLAWLFAVVWGTDILAYFTGRSLGGPKLWPSVSPKKTWSGALGGLVGGVVLGATVLSAFGVMLSLSHIALSIAFSIATQCGDLYESAIKRRYGAKDSGSLIPGHGGFMDRLDGFIFAVILAAGFGLLRGGFQGVPVGLVVW